jgi:glucose-6-phosphate dehydrogenase assembly protein OpcA
VIADCILAEMEALRGTLGRSEHGLFRASAVTLIVLGAESGDAAAEIGEIERRHPNRAIIVRLGDFPEAFGYRVVAQCWRPFGQGEQICSERVELDVAPGGVAGLAPVLLALAEADLPVVLWSRTPGALDLAERLAPALRADSIVVDSEEPGFDVSRLARVQGVADLAWIATAPWRDAMAEERPAEVRIPYAGTRALYAAAWAKLVLRAPARYDPAAGDCPAPSRPELLARALADSRHDPLYPRVLRAAAEMQ